MNLGIKGRRALICGASKGLGLGRGCAEALAEAGVDLILNARTAEPLEVTAAAIRSTHGVQVTCVAADVTTEAGQALVLAAAQGGGHSGHQRRRPASRHLDRLVARRVPQGNRRQHADAHHPDEGPDACDDGQGLGPTVNQTSENTIKLH